MASDVFGDVRVLLLRTARIGGMWRDRGWSGVVRADEAQALIRRGWAVAADAVRDAGVATDAAAAETDAAAARHVPGGRMDGDLPEEDGHAPGI